MAYLTLCRRQGLLEGEMAAFEIQGHEFIILWPEEGEPRVCSGACPHQGGLLRRGFFDGGTLTCPLRIREGMVEDHPGFMEADFKAVHNHGH